MEMTLERGTLRRAGPRDLDSVLGLDRRSPVGHQRTELLTSRVQSGEVIICESDDRLLGYVVVLNRSFFGRDFVELLTVLPDDRRQGIGTLLLHEAVRQSSTTRIFTSTNRSNAAMIGLLAKDGWQNSGQLEGIDEGDPEVVYFRDDGVATDKKP